MNSSKVPIKPGLEISFEVDRDATVYLVWATGEPIQKWLTKDYVKTEDVILMGDDMKAWPQLQKRQVWMSEKPFKPGKVTTYEVTTDAAIYIIVVEGFKSGMAVSHDGKLAVAWGMLKTR